MGKHSDYWRKYQQDQVRGSLRIFAAIGAGLGLVAATVVAQDWLGRAFPWALGAVFLGLVVAIARLGRNAYRVSCPECATVYQRHKWGGQCPACGLRLLQPDP